MAIVKTLTKGQVVIPKPMRDQLGIKVGSQLLVQVIGQDIVMKPLPKDPIRALHGFLKHGGPSTAALLRMHRKEREREEREIA